MIGITRLQPMADEEEAAPDVPFKPCGTACTSIVTFD